MVGTSWTTEIMCPVLGVVLSNSMWTAPFIAILQARKKRDLGPLNPIPFGLVIVNCVGWLIYSFMIKDYYIFFANSTGVVLGGFLCISALQLLVRPEPDEKLDRIRLIVEGLMIGGVLFWVVIALITSIIMESSSSLAQSIVGTLCIVVTLLYYAAPLSTMVEVIKTKNAASLYVPTLLANLANAVLWFFYGLLGIRDVFVWVPNGVGACLALSQLALTMIYPSKKIESDNPGIALVSNEA